MRILLAALMVAASPALAETTISTGATLELYHNPDGPGSTDETDASVHAEIARDGAYLGGSALTSNLDAVNELTLDFGYRGDMSGIGYDLGFTRHVYPKDGASNYGEVVLGLSKDFGMGFSGETKIGYDITNHAASLTLSPAYSVNDKLELSANYKAYEVPGASGENEWDIGASYALANGAEADLRWYDGSDYAAGHVGLVLSWDTSFAR